MKRLLTQLILPMLMGVSIYYLGYFNGTNNPKVIINVSDKVTEPNKLHITDIDIWELFRKALIIRESQNNPFAINDYSGAYGLYQILPTDGKIKGFLHEWNKYHPKEQYQTSDLSDVQLQHRIWDYIQNKYNPQKSIHKAIQLQNPKAGHWFADDIMHIMIELAIKDENNSNYYLK